MITIEKDSALLLYICDAWHTHPSKELIGIFTDSNKLFAYINDMKLSEENTEELLQQHQTYGLDRNYLLKEEVLNPTLSI